MGCHDPTRPAHTLDLPGPPALALDPRPHTVLQVLQREPPILGRRLLALQRVLRPDALGVHELRFPGLHLML